jgi:hypothetical protein
LTIAGLPAYRASVPPTVTHPAHVANLRTNVKSVAGLLGIHSRLTGTGPGRRRDVEVLNRAGIVLLVACWEAYIEDLAELAFDSLIGHAKVATVFPAKVLTTASKGLKEHNDGRLVWKLAGEGWKKVLQQHRDEILKKHIATFNTPRPAQIDGLFEELVGIRSLSSHWSWRGVSNTKAKRDLEALVTTRGDIAHRVLAAGRVLRRDVERSRGLVIRLSFLSSNTVGEFVTSRTGKRPWASYSW